MQQIGKLYLAIIASNDPHYIQMSQKAGRMRVDEIS